MLTDRLMKKERQTYSGWKTKKSLIFTRKEIKKFNAFITKELEDNTLRQGEILNEYILRNDIPTVPETDGIRRNLTDPVEECELLG